MVERKGVEELALVLTGSGSRLLHPREAMLSRNVFDAILKRQMNVAAVLDVDWWQYTDAGQMFEDVNKW